MPVFMLSSMIFTSYLAAGRIGAVTTCLIGGITPLKTLLIVLLIDIFQIPVYGIILEALSRHSTLPAQLHIWLMSRIQAIQKYIKGESFWNSILQIRPLVVCMTSMIPFPGFGILSACIVAIMFGYNRFWGTLLIMFGSFICTLFLIVVTLYITGQFRVL